jgi:hypothetical protein
MNDWQRLYEEFELVAEHLHDRGHVSIEDVELMHPRAVFGLLAVVLFQCVLRSSDPQNGSVSTIGDNQLDPNTVPTDFIDVCDRFVDVRDRVRLLKELTEEETDWLKLRLLDPPTHSDPPARLDRERREGLSEVFGQLYGAAVEMSRLPAFKAHLELIAADFRLLVALRQDRQEDVRAQVLEARALPIAARMGQLRVVHRIMELRGDWGEWLLYAACSGQQDEVELALRNNADVNARSPAGSTPLITAAMEGHAEVVRLLLDWGADPALATNRGLTAYDAAALGSQRGAFDPHQRRRYAEVAAVLNPSPLYTRKAYLSHIASWLSDTCPCPSCSVRGPRARAS